MKNNKNAFEILKQGEVALTGTKTEMISRIDNIFNKFILMIAKYGSPSLHFYIRETGSIINLYAFRENPELKFVIGFTDKDINSIPLLSLVSDGWVVSHHAIRFSVTQEQLVTNYPETFLKNIKSFGGSYFYWEISISDDY
jgi:hypothetical protein